MSAATKCLTRSGLGAAVGFAILYLTTLIPGGRLGLLCLSSLAVIFVLMSCGWRWAVGCFAVTAALALLLLPVKTTALAYALFCGWYPIAKLGLERLPRRTFRWVGKLLLFNIVFFSATLLGRRLLFAGGSWESLSFLWLLLGANAGFLVYDYACKLVILYYIRNIARRLK